MRVLVTGSSGYIGGRLVPELLRAGHTVRVTRRGEQTPIAWWSEQLETGRLETVYLDAAVPALVEAACAGVDAVYYLVHGMGGLDFEETDRAAARNLARAVRRAGVARVVYLSGLVPPVPEEQLSAHIASRLDVERILSAAPATVVTLRAAVVIGSGSTSFEIARQAGARDRVPVRVVPEWTDSLVQPIAVVDVLAALIGALTVPTATRSFDVGGPDRLRYSELMDLVAQATGRPPRPRVRVPLVPVELAAQALTAMTDAPPSTVRTLVASLKHNMVCADDDFVEALLPPGHQLLPLHAAIDRALAAGGGDPRRADPMGPLPHDPSWAGPTPARPER